MDIPEYDVAIIGGGPAGSSLATLVKKYRPQAKVLVLEREVFPREHVGESQLPPCTKVLEEMGCWDKVEAVGFPIKTGALYRWGSSDDLWRFDFLVGQEFEDKPRPAKLQGQRRQTTFHVERSIFDKLLLDHAAERGVEVCQGARVTKIEKDGDRVASLKVEGENGEGRVHAKWYVDASGHAGVLRRAMEVPVSEPSTLKNIAIWQYWRRSDWASMEGIGCGGVRVRVLSIGSGWIWFIPISTDRVSIGFVTHADHYKKSGLSPAELYQNALAIEPHVSELMVGAKPCGEIQSTKDWSFLASRFTGENWLLVGESGGFADPILAGGMALTMVGAREAAHILAAALAGGHDLSWLLNWYGEIQSKRVTQHIKFADYWYAANGHFSELKEHTSKIAAESGLQLNPEEAFQWLGSGGFVSDDLALPVTGTYRLGSVKSAMQILSGIDVEWSINRYNDFRLNLEGSESVQVPYCKAGQIDKVKCFRRAGKLLPMMGLYRMLYRALCKHRDAAELVKELKLEIASNKEMTDPYNALLGALEALEGLIAEGWVVPSDVPDRPHLRVTLDESSVSFANS